MARLSDRGFTASRGLSFTLEDTAQDVDTALAGNITHNLGALPSALELWVEQDAINGIWEKHDPATYVLATATELQDTGTTLESVVGASTNVRLVAAAGAVAVSVQEASETVPGIVGIGSQTFGGDKTFAGAVTLSGGVTGNVDATGKGFFNNTLKVTGNLSGSDYEANSLLLDNNVGTSRLYSVGPDASTRGSYQFNGRSSDGSLISTYATIDSSGNVGIGTSTPDVLLHGEGEAYFSGDHLTNAAGQALSVGYKGGLYANRIMELYTYGPTYAGGSVFSMGANSALLRTVNNAKLGIQSAEEIYFGTNGSASASGEISLTGAWTLGPTSTIGTPHIIQGTFGSVQGVLRVTNGATVDSHPSASFETDSSTNSTANRVLNFYRANTGQGGISFDGGTSVQFTAFSDERLKENFRSAPSQLDKILGLNIQLFDMKDGSATDVFGVTAQNMQTQFPSHVSADESTEEEYLQIGGWGIAEYRLAKAIQELKEIIDAQQAEINLLKNS